MRWPLFEKDVVNAEAQLEELEVEYQFVVCQVRKFDREVQGEASDYGVLTVPHDRLVDKVIVIGPLSCLHGEPRLEVEREVPEFTLINGEGLCSCFECHLFNFF